MQPHEILRTTSEYKDLNEFGVPPEARRVFCLAMSEYIIQDAHGFWLEPESRDGHCDPNRLVITLAERLSALGDLYNGKRTQSPIEDQLGAALLWLSMDWAEFPAVDYLDGPADNAEQYGQPASLVYFITPQAKVADYRVDFLLWFALGRHVAGIAVECDGHAFHEKTKEQASADKRRDRALLTAGYPVMRFSGSDIFKDPLGCARQVGDALDAALDRVSKDGGLYK